MRYKKIIKKHSLLLTALLTVAVILFFGLRPKEWGSNNNIQWLAQENALEFSSPSIAYAPDISSLYKRKIPSEFTIQILFAPASIEHRGFKPVLMIHGGDDQKQLTIWQWGDSVIVMNGNDYDYSKRWPRISGKEVLVAGEKRLLTVTSDSEGARLFIDGSLIAEKQDLQLTLPTSHKNTQLVLGNSVYGTHSWEGRIYGLALSSTTLSSERVADYYKKWSTQADLVFDSTEEPLLLYTFSEYEAGVVSGETGRTQPLYIPKDMLVLKKTFLALPAKAFRPTLWYLFDVLINIIGFVPLGAVLYCWALHSKALPAGYEIFIIVGGCFLLSLGIEITQAWLPYRYSNTIDLICNSLGAWLGVLGVDKIRNICCNVD